MKKAKLTQSPATSRSTDASRLVHELLAIKDRLGKLELWRTYHALDTAIGQLGWELAHIKEGE